MERRSSRPTRTTAGSFSDNSALVHDSLAINSPATCFLSRYGRVNFVLSKRLELLAEVKRLQVSLDMPLYQEHTCESAGYFFTQVRASL